MEVNEAEQFRRIQVKLKIERAEGIIADYRVGIDHYRNEINNYYTTLGHIAERLGEPDEGED